MAEQVLVVLDGSGLASAALPALRRLRTVSDRCGVEVLHVVEGWPMPGERQFRNLGEDLEAAWTYVREQARKLRLPGVEPKASLVLGSIEGTIDDRVARGGFGYVIVAARAGSPQRQAIGRALIRRATAEAQSPRLIDPLIETTPRQGVVTKRQPAEQRQPALLIT